MVLVESLAAPGEHVNRLATSKNLVLIDKCFTFWAFTNICNLLLFLSSNKASAFVAYKTQKL